MVRLHLLGFTPDLKGLVFSGRRGGKSANYFVAVDDRFFEALGQLEDARERKGRGRKRKKKQDAIEEVVNADVLDLEGARAVAAVEAGDLSPPKTNSVESKLSPREIQKLLREGRTVKEVAKRAEVDPEWIERFNGPVREERAGVIRMTRQATLERARLGPSSTRLGEAVVRNLRSRSANAETLGGLDEGWDARQVRPRKWLVRLRFYHWGKNRTAEWEFDQDSRRVEASNKLGTELGWWPRDDKGRPAPVEDTDEGRSNGRSKAKPASAGASSKKTPSKGKSSKGKSSKGSGGKSSRGKAPGNASRRS